MVQPKVGFLERSTATEFDPKKGQCGSVPDLTTVLFSGAGDRNMQKDAALLWACGSGLRTKPPSPLRHGDGGFGTTSEETKLSVRGSISTSEDASGDDLILAVNEATWKELVRG